MEQRQEMDLQRWDAVWQRVAPDLNPYPEVRAALIQQRSCGAPEAEQKTAATAAVTPEALTKAVEEELSARRAFIAHARCAGGAAARALTQMASDSVRHAGRLRSLYYLLTGECYQPIPVCGQTEILSLCQFLRLRYQLAAACAAQLDGWADEMEDGCMASVLRTMAGDKRCQAAALMSLLETKLG